MITRHAARSALMPAIAVALLSVAAAVPAQPVASIGDTHVLEGDAGEVTTMTFTVSLSAPSTETVYVGYYVDHGTGESGVLTFAPGETVKTLPVPIPGNDISDGERYFPVYISDAGGVVVDDRRAFGVIVDDEPSTEPLGVGPGYIRVRYPVESAFGVPGVGSIRVTVRFHDSERNWNYSDWGDEYRWVWDRIRWFEASFVTSTGRVGTVSTCEPEPGGGECGGYDNWYCEEWFYLNASGDRTRLRDVILDRYFEVAAYCEPDPSGRDCGFQLHAGDHLGKAQRPDGCWEDEDHLAFDHDRVERIGQFWYWEDGYDLGAATFSAEPQVSVADTRTVAEKGIATFTVTLDTASTARTTVDYATRDGSAVAGLDYVAATGTVVFEPGVVKRTVSVAILKDVIRDGDETFELVATHVVGGTLRRPAGTATIVDDEVFSVRATPPTVVGCLNATGKVTLAAPAPAGGVTVTLHSDSPNVIVPASLFLTAGALVKGFAIKTSPVAARETATIAAIAPGESASATLTLKPMGPQSVALFPNPVVGGNPVAGTVTLRCPAGPGDILVALSSSLPWLAVPTEPTVRVPAGTQSVPFDVTTTPVDTVRKPTIAAKANGIRREKMLTVNP